MASAQLFSGKWLIEVVSKDAVFSERFVIEGSDASDGIYDRELATTPFVVTGSRWFLRFEWNNNAGSGWQPSDLKRTAAQFTLAGGLVTFLGADDNFPPLRDHDFNDLVLRCRNLDPDLSPQIPPGGGLDFTTPDGTRKKNQPCPPPGGGQGGPGPGHGGLGQGGPGFGPGNDCGPGGLGSC
jgi:hypothetical protein